MLGDMFMYHAVVIVVTNLRYLLQPSVINGLIGEDIILISPVISDIIRVKDRISGIEL